ncbi:MAG: DEAD/DEAH box helicase [Patescibacteria group bacterium]
MSDPNFYGLGIAPNILAILDKLNFTTPTPIQQKSIPQAVEGKDLMGLAQTGTGKTLAFGIPMIQAALRGKRGLVVLPTRELALQVKETFHKIGAPLGIRTVLLVGGESMSRQLSQLRSNPVIIIGTPGRMIDHLEQKTLSLSQVGILVLDEADRMLDMGFAPQLKRLLMTVPKERQTMLFSATMPDAIVQLAHSYMKLPIRIEIAPPGTASAKVTQEVFFLAKQDKPRLLEKLLSEYRGSVLVFSRTKFGAKRISAGVRVLGHTTTELHSNKSLNQRREALDGFRNGRYRILVATDIAARGIDVKGIELVVNYDLPSSPDDYVHRIGRTARAGAAGHAVSFATPDQKSDIRDIERLIRVTLPPTRLPELPPHRATPLPTREFRPRFPSSRPQASRPYGPSRFQGNRSSSRGRRPSPYPSPRPQRQA